MDKGTSSAFEPKPYKKVEEIMSKKASITSKETNYEVQSLNKCISVILELNCNTTVAQI